MHLLLRCQTSLWMMKTQNLPVDVNKKLDVYPFTLEETWAERLFVHLPGIKKSPYPHLDRQFIGSDSRQRVHLVISGFDTLAQLVVIQAALVAHFPNYHGSDRIPLRTRISVITPDIEPARDRFIARYGNLFDNSYYRFIDIDKRTCTLHRPLYAGRREDFVDVEWEFIKGRLEDAYMRDRLTKWAEDASRQLTLVVCSGDDEKDMAQAMSLPHAVYEREISILVRQHYRYFSSSLEGQDRFKCLRTFGMDDEGYDVNLPLFRLARYLNYFYEYNPEYLPDTPTVLPEDEVNEKWIKATLESSVNRYSNLYNVMTIPTKLRSLGHDENDVDRFYALRKDEVEALSKTEHNRWCVERLICGQRPCTDEEREMIRSQIVEVRKGLREKSEKSYYKNVKKAHFDLCAFDELSINDQGVDMKDYDRALTACIPLIVNTYYETYGKKQ